DRGRRQTDVDIDHCIEIERKSADDRIQRSFEARMACRNARPDLALRGRAAKIIALRRAASVDRVELSALALTWWRGFPMAKADTALRADHIAFAVSASAALKG